MINNNDFDYENKDQDVTVELSTEDKTWQETVENLDDEQYDTDEYNQDAEENNDDAASDAAEIDNTNSNAAKVDGMASNSITAYFDEITRYRLLTAEEEQEIGRRMEAGANAQAKMDENEGLSAEERQCLEDQVIAGNKARDTLINSNLRLVVSIAKRAHTQSMDLMDVVQEGNLGLIRATETWDYRKGFKFSTYATWWIKQSISRGIDNGERSIRVPVHMLEKIYKLTKIRNEYAMIHGGETAPLDYVVEKSGMSKEEIRETDGYNKRVISLDTPVGDDDGHGVNTTLSDFIPDEMNRYDPEESANTSQMQKDVRNMLEKTLTDRERYVIEHRFGINSNRPETLQEVGDQMGVTRERVRQLENRALRKLKIGSRKYGIKGYINS